MKAAGFGIIVVVFSFFARAQTWTASPTNPTSSTPSTAPMKAVKKIYRPNPPALPTVNPWIVDFLGFADFYQNSAVNKQWEEVHFGYHFTEVTSLVLDLGYSGLMQPQTVTDAEIWDPELLLGFKIPLTSRFSKDQWFLLTGTSLVLPASPDSVKNGLLAGFSANLGLTWVHGPWSVVNTNTAYAFAYQFQPTTLPDNPGGDNSDTSNPVPVQPGDLTYVSTQQMLRLVYEFNPQVSMKLETWYNMYFTGGPLPMESLQVISTIGYYLTPHFRIFTGFTSSTEVDKASKPNLLTADSTGYRAGFFVKW